MTFLPALSRAPRPSARFRSAHPLGSRRTFGAAWPHPRLPAVIGDARIVQLTPSRRCWRRRAEGKVSAGDSGVLWCAAGTKRI